MGQDSSVETEEGEKPQAKSPHDEFRSVTPEDRQQVRNLVSEIGIVPVLRMVAGIIASDHLDSEEGVAIRAQLLKVAIRLRELELERAGQ